MKVGDGDILAWLAGVSIVIGISIAYLHAHRANKSSVKIVALWSPCAHSGLVSSAVFLLLCLATKTAKEPWKQLYLAVTEQISSLCCRVNAPLDIAGPILSFNDFTSQLYVPQNTDLVGNVPLNSFCWTLILLLIDFMTHLFYYNILTNSGLWNHLSPIHVFIIGSWVLNLMWLKFLLIWCLLCLCLRLLINVFEAPRNMP